MWPSANWPRWHRVHEHRLFLGTCSHASTSLSAHLLSSTSMKIKSRLLLDPYKLVLGSYASWKTSNFIGSHGKPGISWIIMENLEFSGYTWNTLNYGWTCKTLNFFGIHGKPWISWASMEKLEFRWQSWQTLNFLGIQEILEFRGYLWKTWLS